MYSANMNEYHCFLVEKRIRSYNLKGQNSGFTENSYKMIINITLLNINLFFFNLNKK
jgi:hypothetical protein